MVSQAAQALEFIPVHQQQVAIVAQLAREIWSEHYVSIIGQAQVDYMLAHLQSETAIAAQLAEGYEYFLIRGQSQGQGQWQWLGYASVHNDADTQRLFISKLYLLKAARQQGTGRATLLFLARQARQRGLYKLWLTVNKHNSALNAYLRIGFIKITEVVTDIGDGYVMDDYLLEWTPAADTYNS